VKRKGHFGMVGMRKQPLVQLVVPQTFKHILMLPVLVDG
jgi:hypothetical protein